MNVATSTGWLQAPANKAYTPRGTPKLVFDLMVASDEPEAPPTPYRCEIEDRDLITRTEPMLTAGRALIVQAKLCGRPFMEHKVQKGFSRYLRVTAVEFVKLDRGNAVNIAEEEGATI